MRPASTVTPATRPAADHQAAAAQRTARLAVRLAALLAALLAGPALLLAALPLQAQTGTAAPARPKAAAPAVANSAKTAKAGSAAKAAKPASPHQQLSNEAKGLALASATTEAINANQLDIAARVLTGPADCEFKQTVHVLALPGKPGLFTVEHKGKRFVMSPRETSTGAVRLEDPAAGVVWLQIPTKSMLMNARIGQRMVDSCQHSEQRAATLAVAGAAQSLGIEPRAAVAAAAASAPLAEIAPAAAATAAVLPGAAPASPSPTAAGATDTTAPAATGAADTTAPAAAVAPAALPAPAAPAASAPPASAPAPAPASAAASASAPATASTPAAAAAPATPAPAAR